MPRDTLIPDSGDAFDHLLLRKTEGNVSQDEEDDDDDDDGDPCQGAGLAILMTIPSWGCGFVVSSVRVSITVPLGF